jgi:hypothetical protein
MPIDTHYPSGVPKHQSLKWSATAFAAENILDFPLALSTSAPLFYTLSTKSLSRYSLLLTTSLIGFPLTVP